MFAYLWGLLRDPEATARRVVLGLAVPVLLCAAPHAVLAGEDEGAWDAETAIAESVTPETAALELWSGADNTGANWAFYTGLTAAPGGVTQPGVRLRLTLGMSTYAYVDSLGLARAAQPFADLLAGYQWQLGSLTLKAFAGATGAADIRTAEQALELWGQARIAAKVVGEAWWTIDPQGWASFDVAIAGPQATLWSRARYGLRVLPQFSLGPEAGLSGEARHPGGRIGAFARFDWAAGEVAISGGITSAPVTSTVSVSDTERGGRAPYLTLLWLQRF